MFPAGEVILLDHQSIRWISIPAFVGLDVNWKTDISTDIIIGIRCVIVHVVFGTTDSLYCISYDFSRWVILWNMSSGTVGDLTEEIEPGIIRIPNGRALSRSSDIVLTDTGTCSGRGITGSAHWMFPPCWVCYVTHRIFSCIYVVHSDRRAERRRTSFRDRGRNLTGMTDTQ